MRAVPSLLLALACAAPDPVDDRGAVGVLPPVDEVVDADGAPVVQGLERQGDGLFLAGADEVFHAVVDDPDATLTWSADGGTLDADGDRAVWTLPDRDGTATLILEAAGAGGVTRATFTVRLAVVAPAATGQVDTSGDETGSVCDLAIDGNDVPHILYRNDFHEQIWYATFVGGQWVTELYDGPGFGVGDYIGDDAPMVQVTGNGDVEVVSTRENGTVLWARRVGNAWQREIVTLTGQPHNRLNDVAQAVALHTEGASTWVGYTDASTDNAIIAKRTAANTWTPNAYYDIALEFWGMGWDDGTLWVSMGENARYVTGYDTTTDMWGSRRSIPSGGYDIEERVPVAASGDTILLWGPARLKGSDNGGLTWDFEARVTAGKQYGRDVVFDGTGVPHILHDHENTLEYAIPRSDGLWDFQTLATGIDRSELGLALDTQGNPHACYQKNGSLWFY